MTDPAAVLAGCLPADPAEQPEGIAVPTDAVRGVLAELVQLRQANTRPHPYLVGRDETGAVLPGGSALLSSPAEDGGA